MIKGDEPDKSDLIPTGESGELTTEMQDLVEEAEDIIGREGSENTERAYRSAHRSFAKWCTEKGFEFEPTTPQVVILYLTQLAHEHKVSTVQVHLSAINVLHERAGFDRPSDEPTVRRFMRNLRKEKGVRPDPKDHLTPEHVLAMLVGLDLQTLAGLRDRAVLLLGFVLGARREEIAGLDLADVIAAPQGLVVLIRSSKADQEGKGVTLGVPRASIPEVCPVEALRAWTETAGLTGGPLFRTIDRHGNLSVRRLPDKSVARIVKDGITRIGLDPNRFAGHSLRSGLATSAAEEGVSAMSIQARLRHATPTMTGRYVHTGTLFTNNPAQPVLDRLVRAALKRD